MQELQGNYNGASTPPQTSQPTDKPTTSTNHPDNEGAADNKGPSSASCQPPRSTDVHAAHRISDLEARLANTQDTTQQLKDKQAGTTSRQPKPIANQPPPRNIIAPPSPSNSADPTSRQHLHHTTNQSTGRKRSSSPNSD